MLLLLFELFNGTQRLGEPRRKLQPISPKTLTDRLRLLEGRESSLVLFIQACRSMSNMNLPRAVKEQKGAVF